MARNDKDYIIDAELRVIGQESLSALSSLVAQMEKITRYQAGIGEMSPEGRAAAARNISRGTSGIVQSGTAGTHSEPPPRILRPAEEYHGLGGKARWLSDRIADKEEHERQDVGDVGSRYAHRTTSIHRPQYWETQGGEGSGSVPPDPQIGIRKLKSDLGAYKQGTEPFVYPQFGSLTWQDRAMLLSELSQRWALRKIDKRATANTEWNAAADQATTLDDLAALGPEPQYSNYEPWQVGATNVLRAGAAGLGIGQGVHADIKRVMARVTGFQDPGIQAGYAKAGSLDLGPFGITNPFDFFNGDSAAKETARQKWTTARLRMKGGINGEQANQIVGSLAALGWNGDEGQGIALDTIAPLVQQGLDPSMTAEMYDKSMRHGNTSLKEFNQTMEKLGQSAAASKMSLDEYQASLAAAGQTAKENGGFYRQGMQSAREFSDATGLGPQALSQSWSSPLVQGMAMSNYGIMPNAMGTMTGNMGLTNVYSSLEVAKQATSMFATRDTIDPSTGQTISGKDAQYAQMAKLMGMSAEEVKRLDKQQPLLQAASRGIGRLDTYSKMVTGHKAEMERSVDEQMKRDPTLSREEAVKNWESTITGPAGVNWESVQRSMYQTAGLSNGALSKKEKSEIKRISRLSGEERIKEAQKFLRDQDKFPDTPDQNTVKVKFTGLAEKMLMVDGKNPWSDANLKRDRGGKASNSLATTPEGAYADAQTALRQAMANRTGTLPAMAPGS